MSTIIPTEGRHPGVAAIAPFFASSHLPAHLAEVSGRFEDLAANLVGTLPDHPELTVALRKLLEAKDAAVRTAVATHQG